MTDIDIAPRRAAAGGCNCGCSSREELPELDARLIPPAIRHGAIFGALDSLAPGTALALVAPHDPLPLLRQIGERYGDDVEATYLVSGPETWRVRLARQA